MRFFNFLLDLVNPDNIPDGYSTIDFSFEEFIIGFILGIAITVTINFIIKTIKDWENKE